MTLPEIIKAEQEKARLFFAEIYGPHAEYDEGLDAFIASSMLAAVKGAEEVVVPEEAEKHDNLRPEPTPEEIEEDFGVGNVGSDISMAEAMCFNFCRTAVSAAFRSFIGETK